jgi:hypothetical protein
LPDYAYGGGGQIKWCESKGYKYIELDYMLDYVVDTELNPLQGGWGQKMEELQLVPLTVILFVAERR